MVGKEFGNNIQDVTDPTDWLNTPLSSLKDVDAALRCEVCKDFYRTPMITACSHTFCSLCIRRCLVNDGKCPTCRTPEQEVRLRSNWAMEGLVVAFVKARPVALEHVQKHVVTKCPPSPKRYIYEADLGGQEYEQPRKRTRSSGRIPAGSKEKASVVVIDRDGDDEAYRPGETLSNNKMWTN
jgi:E3 ubiquitin-protein ligase RAD18